MADALVSIILERLASIIEQEVTQEVRLVVGVTKEVKKLSTTLTKIRAVLEDAEQKQVKEKLVKVWLEDLKDIAYDIDDVLDEWSTEIFRSKMEGVENVTGQKKKVCSYFFSPCFGFNRVVLRHDIGHKIKDMRERLDEIENEKDKYNFNLSGITKEPVPQETSSIIDITEVYGRDDDKDNITSKLLGESSQEEMGLPVISIVGMGGIGKTALAQFAFNKDEVKAHFDHRMWVCVSKPFDQIRIAKAIIEGINKNVPEIHSWEGLHQHLCNSVKGKRFLLILDDVWTEDRTKWESLKRSLKLGAQGSRILVTTRNERVAVTMDTTYMVSLKALSDQDCWSVLSRIAFLGRRVEECEELEEIGKKIASKCKGLPLSAKALGGLLQFKTRKREWQNVYESETWELEEVQEGVLPALLLSYYDLPSYLKCCFTYCAVIPKDHFIIKQKLIKLWMSQGFISSEGRRELEIKGEEYFDNLVRRSFFQDLRKSSNGNIYGCKMHDMVHDFAQFLTDKECFIMKSNNAEELNYHKGRHSTVMDEVVSDSTLSSIYNAKKLRTLNFIGRWESINTPPPNLFCHLTCLRALDLGGTFIEELPREVGKLIHLRYLNLSWTELKELPETVSNLYNLQNLNLNGCKSLGKLPEGIGKLICLRHLEIEEPIGLSHLPRGIGSLSSLRTLCKFIVGGGVGGCKVGDLKNLNLLQGYLEIFGLKNVEKVNEAKEAELKNKQHLHGLNLDFELDEMTSIGGCEVAEETIEGVIEGLQPHPNLEILKIYNYPGTKFPKNWLVRDDVGSLLVSHLVSLTLSSCKNCMQLPPSLGKLPFLEELRIRGMDAVTYMGHEFFGIKNEDDGTARKDVVPSSLMAFPKLKTIVLCYMGNLEEWDMTPRMDDDDITIMPLLCSMEFEYCPKLKELPYYLLQNRPQKKLSIRCCSILEGRCQKELGEDWSKISHIPNININYEQIK